MQRRVEQPHGHRPVAGDAEQVEEVLLLRGRELDQGGGLLVRDRRRAGSGARPAAGRRGTGARCGTGPRLPRRAASATAASRPLSAFARTPSRRSPSARCSSSSRSPPGRGGTTCTEPGVERPAAAVDGDDIALGERRVADCDESAGEVDLQRRSRRRPPAARGPGPRRRRGRPARRARDDRLRCQHPGQVAGRRLVGDQHDRIAVLAPLDRAVAAERDPADRRAGRGRQSSAERDLATRQLQLGMQQRLEVGVADASGPR